ncbi:hypothetical protein BAUCODRAFT_80723 [Baudoinia panamericana UAMH 10762]|uniref:S1/P1 nuclease n=1 Tax=Baudoinia panamericana (strain UAMH 10762) TaxID=717646 RepID=M2MHU8_BAUPA|nr:uncharacterized protein BAUCODRAFT_80723 [Baudoinia panamericana UAMH 10762]EMC90833.1 hypothetical protein BAUCODRAFT_80723 [Baudoinia panamericana UAMH 10762]
MKFILPTTVLGSASLVVAWGDLGHRTVGYLAQHYFTDAANQYVNDLIRPSDTFDISDAAVWPDKARNYPEYKYTANWQFIDAQDDPPNACNVNYKRDCEGENGCIISALVNQTAVLQDSSADAKTRQDAIKFILHFIGDIHQPLHTEAIDRGGNQIKVSFDGKHSEKLNLHEVWDTEILNKLNGLKRDPKGPEEKQAAQEWADKLFQAAGGSSNFNISAARNGQLCDSSNNAQDCVLEYATETNALVCNYVLAPRLDWLESNDLGGEYYAAAVPIVEDRITKAGQRLAVWVNALATQTQGVVVQKQDLK